MITDVEIRDYQAVREAALRLGKFTVITGPTGSGKSAVIRAMRMVVFNARGTSYVRHGAKTAKAGIGFREEVVAVGIERGGRGKDAYRISRPTDPEQGDFEPKVETFTKLEGKVPGQVSDMLRLGSINFAGQLDMPFLLTESGGQVARVLGELTNVTLVLDAAREANRRKLETARDLRQAEAALAALTEQARGFRGLKARRAAIVEAMDHLGNVDRILGKLGRLRALDSSYQDARQAHGEALAQLTVLTPPSVERLEETQARLWRLRELAEISAEAKAALEEAHAAVRAAHRDHVEAEEELHDLLTEAGVCPTCGQQVSGP